MCQLCLLVLVMTYALNNQIDKKNFGEESPLSLTVLGGKQHDLTPLSKLSAIFFFFFFI